MTKTQSGKRRFFLMAVTPNFGRVTAGWRILEREKEFCLMVIW
jgi:hypothetical protein